MSPLVPAELTQDQIASINEERHREYALQLAVAHKPASQGVADTVATAQAYYVFLRNQVPVTTN